MGKENELRYFDSLTKIAKGYMTTEQLKKRAEKEYGVSYHEALEMAYDNVQAEAADAIFGKRRPKMKKMIPYCAEHKIKLVDGRCEKCRDANGQTFVLDMQSIYLDKD